jgi:prepilin-type processing-associated H-X9-DG protein
MTLTEVLVVIVVLAVLTLVFFPWPEPRARKKAARIVCVNNLKQIGLAYKLWPSGQSDKYPMQISVTNGGAKELVASGNVAANFLVMSNELSTPKILVCPADNSRVAATNFSTDFNNGKISYFTGLDAAEEYPQRFLSGDDNFAIGGIPVKSGLLALLTNAPITWIAARHTNQGNIGLADGSVWQTDDKQLVQKLIETGLATNRLAIP